MADLTLPRGDYGYNLDFTVQGAAGGTYSLAGYTVTLKVWREKIAGLVMSGICTVINPSGGTCRYEVASGDFNRPGVYKAELELTKSGVVESSQSFDLEVARSQ